MDATCHIPRIHRLELRHYVNRPLLEVLPYYQSVNDTGVTRATSNDAELDAQLKKVKKKISVLVNELGWWAATTFVDHLIVALVNSVQTVSEHHESRYFCRKQTVLQKLQTLASDLANTYVTGYGECATTFHVSEKVSVLIKRLNQLAEAGNEVPMTGIVFARQRIVVRMLQIILSQHPGVSRSIRSAPYVGQTGAVHYGRELSELLIPRTQTKVMQEFRSGSINLIVSTDSLDEGIDVAACNAIICFDEPENLRSYVQKRGRARQSHSVYVMMVPDGANTNRGQVFEDTEAQIIQILDDEDRRAALSRELESVEEHVDFAFESKQTGFVIREAVAISC